MRRSNVFEGSLSRLLHEAPSSYLIGDIDNENEANFCSAD